MAFKSKAKNDGDPAGSDSDDGGKPFLVRSATDLQRIRLEKLMSRPVSSSNADKPVHIPDKRKEKKFSDPPEFIRNVMGSSAGAGSGEFHIYRHIRRREFARQQFLDVQGDKQRLDEEYQEKLEENKRALEERTAKKRAKRLKKKKNAQKKAKTGGAADHAGKSSDEEDDEDEKQSSPAKKSAIHPVSFRESDGEHDEESAGSADES